MGVECLAQVCNQILDRGFIVPVSCAPDWLDILIREILAPLFKCERLSDHEKGCLRLSNMLTNPLKQKLILMIERVKRAVVEIARVDRSIGKVLKVIKS